MWAILRANMGDSLSHSDLLHRIDGAGIVFQFMMEPILACLFPILLLLDYLPDAISTPQLPSL